MVVVPENIMSLYFEPKYFCQSKRDLSLLSNTIPKLWQVCVSRGIRLCAMTHEIGREVWRVPYIFTNIGISIRFIGISMYLLLWDPSHFAAKKSNQLWSKIYKFLVHYYIYTRTWILWVRVPMGNVMDSQRGPSSVKVNWVWLHHINLHATFLMCRSTPSTVKKQRVL